LTAGCQPTPPEFLLSQSDVEVIRTLAANHAEAVLSADSAIAALYTEDAVQNPPGRPSVRGRAAIRDSFQAHATSTAGGASLWGLTAQPDGYASGFLYDWGVYDLVLTGADSADLGRHAGKYLVVLQRQPSGIWLVHREMWILDQPALPR
jgi:ketosteroid isomerase-like protein